MPHRIGIPIHSTRCSGSSNMAYNLTVKIIGCNAPVGDYYVLMALNKSNKKDKHECKTDVTKKTANPKWVHVTELYVCEVYSLAPWQLISKAY